MLKIQDFPPRTLQRSTPERLGGHSTSNASVFAGGLCKWSSTEGKSNSLKARVMFVWLSLQVLAESNSIVEAENWKRNSSSATAAIFIEQIGRYIAQEQLKWSKK